MKSKNPSPNEQFLRAVTLMATSPKTIQERIGDAYIYNLSHIKAGELPKIIRTRFAEMVERLTRCKPDLHFAL